MTLEQLQPSRGKLDPTAVAFEAGRRSVTVWPWRVASGVLAAGFMVAVLLPALKQPTPVQMAEVLSSQTPASQIPAPQTPASQTHVEPPRMAPVSPQTPLAMQRALLRGDPLPRRTGLREKPIRLKDLLLPETDG